MKESLVAVLTGFQSLSNDDSRERPVDRLHAVGAGQQRGRLDRQTLIFSERLREAHLVTLGRDLIAFKYSHSADAHEKAISGLTDALGWKKAEHHLRPRQRPQVARWAIQEWVIDSCPTCWGRKIVPDHDIQGLEGRQPMKNCGTCSATGKRRYDDAERREALGDLAGVERGLALAHGLIGEAEKLCILIAVQMSGRQTEGS